MQSKKIYQLIKELASLLVNTRGDQKAINIQRSLRDFLEYNGYSSLRSFELSDEWIGRLHQELEDQLTEWDFLGVPRPLIPANHYHTFLTLYHPKYKSYFESGGLSEEFHEVLNFVTSLSPRDFLLIPACLLDIAGCKRIFITEGNDGGVDCIGQITQGSLRSMCIFIQAKTSSTNINKDTVVLEYAKFQDLQTKIKYLEYLSALGRTIDGQSACYIIIANSEFDKAAREYALQKNFLLRSRKQISFLLSQNFNMKSLSNLHHEIRESLVKNLRNNLAPIISSYRLKTKT